MVKLKKKICFIRHIHNYTEYNQQWNVFSALNPSKCTHTHTWSSGQPKLRRLWSIWGIGALLKGLTSVVVLKVERTLIIHSPYWQFLPDLRFKPTTSGYKSDFLTIRPRLPRLDLQRSAAKTSVNKMVLDTFLLQNYSKIMFTQRIVSQ